MSALLDPTTAADAGPAHASGLHSCLYEGTIGHRRHVDVGHGFSQPIVLAYLDLDEVDDAFAAHPLWSTRRPAPVRFRRSDMHGDADVPLAEAVRRTLAEGLGAAPAGPVRVLTHLRHWGWTFNPISIYFTFDAADTRVEAVLVEVTNTPWHERKAYTLSVPSPEEVESRGLRFAKELHVSPFLGPDLDHVLRFSPPGTDRLVVEMDDRSQAAGLEAGAPAAAAGPLPAEARSARRLGLAPTPAASGAAAGPTGGGPRDIDRSQAASLAGADRADDVRAGELVFSARMVLRQRPLDHASMAHVLRAHRLPSHRVSAGIHLNALRLWRKGAPFRRHPKHTEDAPT